MSTLSLKVSQAFDTFTKTGSILIDGSIKTVHCSVLIALKNRNFIAKEILLKSPIACNQPLFALLIGVKLSREKK